MAEKKDNIIEFPKILKERIGTKWRVKEIEALQKYLRECDEDMTTLLDQLDIINKELLVLNKEYEASYVGFSLLFWVAGWLKNLETSL